MPPSMSLEMRQKQSQSLKQIQRLIMSPQMQQAIHLLQMPVQELTEHLEDELAQNPVLENPQDDAKDDKELETLERENDEGSDDRDIKPEQELSFNEHDFEILKQLDEEFRDHFAESGNYYTKRTMDEEKLKTFLESSVCSQISLFEHLMKQARETFDSEEELGMAEAIIGNLDEAGFLKTLLGEIALLNHYDLHKLEKVLEAIQTFEPAGVGASSLQESLLIQLRMQGKQNTLAYHIISENYDDLLHNRIPQIQKTQKCSAADVTQTIKNDVSKLDLHPGAWFSHPIVQHIVPDVTIEQEGDQLRIVVNDDMLPPMRLNRRYMRMLEDESLPLETKEFIRNKIMSAKWLLRNIHQRNETIEKIANSLVKRQKEYFLNPDGKLVPLTMKTLADELDLHESTIARAVSNKYMNSPRGIIPLRSFFTNAYVTNEGVDISSRTVRDELSAIIQGEDKHKPLSDEAISAKLKAKGIICARRTVAKYRTELNIGNAQQRRHFD